MGRCGSGGETSGAVAFPSRSRHYRAVTSARLDRYLASLPRGLSSHPDAVMKGDIFDYMRTSFPGMLDGIEVPAPVARLFADQIDGPWVPEVVGNALYLVCREVKFRDDASFLAWSFDAAADLFKTPLYRVLMMVLSPTLVVMGAAKRWSAFHQGSTLTATPAQKADDRLVVHGSLKYPAGLFDPLILELLGKGFEAAVSGAGGKDAKSITRPLSEGETQYELTWKA